MPMNEYKIMIKKTKLVLFFFLKNSIILKHSHFNSNIHHSIFIHIVIGTVIGKNSITDIVNSQVLFYLFTLNKLKMKSNILL